MATENDSNWVNCNDKLLTTSESSTSLASGSPWFEPLENIISSNSSSSSSVTSPDSNFLIDGNQNDIFLFNVDNFELSNDVRVKKEDEELATLGSTTPTSMSMSMSTSNPGAKKQKKKAPRKRLTQNQKEAHNKIEKRYRININSKLARLQQIIPWVASEQSTLEVLEGNRKGNKSDDMDDPFSTFPTTTPKLNKSMILEKAVDYILYMQNNERLFELEVHRLKAELGTVKKENEKLKQTNMA
ncbi:Transcription factor TYE7 [Nakaseomyces bracarensis]|uniref:Transcription factor TYE7 n=1 Tax=Nakaseomyces bracarensis TaxID=273131 RepID=A0ABR4NNY6_9SACH